MSSPRGGILSRAWLRWKALRLPWRRRFLVGTDLQGNTFWIFRDPGSSSSSPQTRWRRIVEYSRHTHNDAVQVSPAWHQWLRHTREQPPSIQEQQGDLVRQAQLKVLAAQADARWEAKARLVGGPAANEGVKQIDREVWGAAQPVTGPGETSWAKTKTQEQSTIKQQEEDPWKRAKGGPSEQWQPQAWSPGGALKR